MSKSLQNQEFTAKIEQPAKVLATPDGPNRRSTFQGGATMADKASKPILSEKSTENIPSTWQPIGAIVARLIGAK